MKPMEISKESKFTLSLEFLAIIVGGTISLLTIYFSLKSDIEEAKLLPKPAVTAEEYQLKDQLLRTTVDNIDKKVDRMDQRLEKIEEKLMR
jgi:Mg2+ and Co2+ transporter CorA